MCWRSHNNNVQYAASDIEVFKVVRVDETTGSIIPYYMAPYYISINCVLIYGKKTDDGVFACCEKPVYENKIAFYIKFNTCNDLYECNMAFHSYDIKMLKDSTVIDHDTLTTFTVYYKTNERDYYYLKDNILIMRCIIPKGTRYAVNENGEYISDKIKVVSFEEIKNNYVLEK